MKPVLLVVVATFALLAISRWAIASGDRQTFAAGPDATAESFMESVLLRRGDPAHAHLTDAAAARVSADSLIALGGAIQVMRRGTDAETTIQSIDSNRSIVRVEILFHDGSTGEFALALHWEKDNWRVPDVAPVEAWLTSFRSAQR